MKWHIEMSKFLLGFKKLISFIILLIITFQPILADAAEKFTLLEQRDLPNQLGTFRHIQNVNNINVEFYSVLLNDPYHARIYRQKTKSQTEAVSLKELNQTESFLLGVNGSFYTNEFKPAGLYIEEGRMMSPLSRESLLNSCVRIHEQKVILESNRKNCLHTFSAMQIGPALIHQGQIAGNLKMLENKSEKAKAFFDAHRRTILALSNKNKLLVIVSTPISLIELASILKESPEIFGVKEIKTALNLDGGSSTGMYIQFNNYPFYYPEYKNVKTLLLFN